MIGKTDDLHIIDLAACDVRRKRVAECFLFRGVDFIVEWMDVTDQGALRVREILTTPLCG